MGKLLGCDAESIRNAIAIAGGYSGGLMQYDHGGGSVKRIYPAIAASSGIMAAVLAQAGLTGPEEILEGARGALKIYASNYRPERLSAELGTTWMLDHLRIKPYSCCGAIHAAIDGFRKITTDCDLAADSIATVEVGYPRHTYEHVAIAAPHDVLGMQFSTAFTLALTLLRGRNTPREYNLQALAEPAIREFASRVSIRENAELNAVKGKYPARVVLYTRSGARHEALVLDPKGSPGAPLSGAEIDEKFQHQAAPVLGAERCGRLLRALRSIDTLDDMGKLFPLRVVKKETGVRKPA